MSLDMKENFPLLLNQKGSKIEKKGCASLGTNYIVTKVWNEMVTRNSPVLCLPFPTSTFKLLHLPILRCCRAWFLIDICSIPWWFVISDWCDFFQQNNFSKKQQLCCVYPFPFASRCFARVVCVCDVCFWLLVPFLTNKKRMALDGGRKTNSWANG